MSKFLLSKRLQEENTGDNGGSGGGDGGAGGDAGDSSNSGDNGGSNDGTGDSGSGGDDGGDAESDDSGQTGTSEAEAKLLKEVMRRKDDNKALKADADAKAAALSKAEDELKVFKDAKAAAELKALEDAKDFEGVKARMAEQHKADMEAKLNDQQTSLSEKIQALETENNRFKTDNTENLMKAEFSGSGFLNDETTLLSDHARAIYGGHFEVEDNRVVGYSAPVGAANRVKLIDGQGVPLGFNSAISEIIKSDPNSKRILKSKMKAGANSGSDTSGKGGSDADGSNLTGMARIQAGLDAAGKA